MSSAASPPPTRSTSQRVPDASGFVRAGGPLDGKVSLVIGGGSGHYPSYNGVVGTGFADGAVLGDLFASPSAEQVYRVARAANGGAGVVLGFGNYAGDRLNFRVAADRLIAEGIDTRIVYVTDDIASAQPRGARQAARHRRHLHRLQDRRRRGRGRRRPRRGGAGDDRGQRGHLLLRRRLRRLHDAGRRPTAVHRRRRADGLRARHPRRTGDQLRALDDRARPGAAGSSRRCWPSAPTTRAVGPRCSSTASARPSTRSCSPSSATSPSSSKPPGSCWSSRRSASWSPASTWPAARCRSPGWTTSSKRYWVAPADTPAFRRGTAVDERALHRASRGGRPRRGDRRRVEASDESRAAAEVARRAVARPARDRRGAQGVPRPDRRDRRRRRPRHRDVARLEGGRRGGGRDRGRRPDGAGGGRRGVRRQGRRHQRHPVGPVAGRDRQGAGQHREGHGRTRRRRRRAVRAPTCRPSARPASATRRCSTRCSPSSTRSRVEVGGGRQLADAWRTAAEACVAAAEATASLTPKIGRARPLAERSIGTPDPGAISLGLIVTAIGEVLAGDSSVAASNVKEDDHG